MSDTATAPRAQVARRGEAERDLQLTRSEAHQDFMTQPGKTLADLSETEFEDGLKRLTLMHDRMQKIFATVLKDGVHYGNPEVNGRKAFKKPMLYQAGAETLRNLTRLSLRHMQQSPMIEHSAEHVNVVVLMGIYDAVGRLIATRTASCNSIEKRFRKYDGRGWVYDDPRSEIHSCLAMAEKRCGAFLTKEATGATEFFANEEQIPGADEEDRPITPMTADEKRSISQAALNRQMNRGQLETLIVNELGRLQVGTGPEVKRVLDKIAQWQAPTKKSDPAAPKAGAEPQGKGSFDDMPDALTGDDDDLPF
jgi:hypothetical protein